MPKLHGSADTTLQTESHSVRQEIYFTHEVTARQVESPDDGGRFVVEV